MLMNTKKYDPDQRDDPKVKEKWRSQIVAEMLAQCCHREFYEDKSESFQEVCRLLVIC